MTDRVNGGIMQGDFLTGQMDFYTIATAVPVDQTNVETPVADLPGYQTWATTGVWSNVTVQDGHGIVQTYTTVGTYLDAFYKQLNLYKLVGTFALRANPVTVTVTLIDNVAPATAGLTSYYGSFYNINE